MSRKAGDWDCASCQYLNFGWRDSCQRCSDPRPRGASGGRSDEGDDGFTSFRRGAGGSDREYGRSYGSGSDRDYGRSYGGGSDRDYGRSYGGGSDRDYGRSFGGGGGYGSSDVRPGDWNCPARGCGTHNFASRSSCFKCGALKDGAADGGGGREGGYEGGSRYSKGSSFGFGSSYNSSSRMEFKSGDWICGRDGCKEHNFANRTECFRCHAPRESGAAD